MTEPARPSATEEPAPGAGTGPLATRHAGSIAVPGEPTELSLTYESGLELKARSQWSYVRRRFLRHRLAMVSLVVLVIIFGAGALANHIAPYSYDQINLFDTASKPTLHHNHFFGTDQLGRDYFSRVIYGIRTSERVSLLVAIVATIIGALVGAVSGYFGGWIDNLAMRVVDLLLTLPLIAVLLAASVFLGQGHVYRIAFIIAFLIWTGLARIVRGTFLSLREKEFVEAAKASGSGDMRIILRHILPNAMGPIVVNATLTVGTAILLEAALSFLGFGIQPPTPSLGTLINDGASQGLDQWWLVIFPGLTIVLIVLCINFIGDGLRDALDPTQRRVRA